ncbi:hypothetical protein [Brevibacillus daliensis]|nr:hypothetical protein [Brevibacillus daliensis]
MGGRGKGDKSRRRNHSAFAKPGSLDQFGKKIDQQRMSFTPYEQRGREL